MTENWLLMPVIILYIWSFGLTGYTLDLHLHDTYFIVDGVSTFRILAGCLLLIFGLYKTIRNRHQTINQAFAVPHIFITILLTGFLLIPFAIKFQDSASKVQYIDYSHWRSYESNAKWALMAVFSFLLSQIIFLIYFVVQLVRKPASGRP